MKKAIFSLLLMAASVIGSSAQGNATALNPQDVDVRYAKNTLAEQFEESHRLENEIMRQLNSINFNDNAKKE